MWQSIAVQRGQRAERVVRYADDAVLCFKSEQVARRVLAVLVKRLGRFGLSLNTTKTKLIRFAPKGPVSQRSSKKLTWERLYRLLDRYPFAPAVLPLGSSSR